MIGYYNSDFFIFLFYFFYFQLNFPGFLVISPHCYF